MNQDYYYESPLGKIFLQTSGSFLTGLSFCSENTPQKSPFPQKDDTPTAQSLLCQTKKWLDIYFSRKAPNFTPPLLLVGTDFQKEVWSLLQKIPFGTTTTYGALASLIEKRRGIKKMASQAIGGAVSRNPVAIIVPCHRVIGAGNKLTGYAGGIFRKKKLLELEGVEI